MAVFAKCHPDKVHEAKGLCSNCYVKERMARKAILEGRIPHKGGTFKPKSKATCHPDRYLHGKGLCKTCYSGEYKKQHTAKVSSNRPNVEFKSRLKRLYHMDESDFHTLYVKQEGRCAICQNLLGDKFHIDHNHATNRVRGILCRACNTGIGMLKDSIEITQKALNYLSYTEKDSLVISGGIPLIGARVIAIDFDNTLYPMAGLLSNPPPMLGGPEALRELSNNNYYIVILTSRLSKSWHDSEGWDHLEATKIQTAYIENILRRDSVPFDLITAEKIPAECYVDDKAYRFENNWDEVVKKIIDGR
jgi:hypothetical protein